MPFQSSAVDNDELAHLAARRGHVISLEIYLNQNANCVNKLFTHNKSKWTLLLAACFHKHEHVVRMLVTRFKPDIDAMGTVVLNSPDNRLDIAIDASPLWTAAAVNQFDIVKLLVEHGKANVNHLIRTHSTAIRGACYHNNLEMVRYLVDHGANPHQKRKGNYTNLMLSAGRQYLSIVKYLVNDLKCDINEQDEYGQTALYYAVRSRSVEITRFLLEHGALNIRDNKRKVTPLIRAALFGDSILVNAFEGYCSDLEYIDAKELLATSFAGCISHIENLNKAIEYLTEAFNLRLVKKLPKKIRTEPLGLFNHRRECTTIEQFNHLLRSNAKNNLFIEAIFIHQRILGDDQKDYHDVIHNYGASLAQNLQYHDCFLWWFYEFNLKRKYNITLQNDYFNHLINLFTKMKMKNHLDIPIDDLLRMFQMIEYVLASEQNRKHFDYNLVILLHLITIAARMIQSQKIEEKQNLSTDHCRELCKAIRYLMRYQYRTIKTGSSLLHLSSNVSTNVISFSINYPCWMTTRLLLHCDLDVDAMDFDGNTSLHILLQNMSSMNVSKLIDLFCDADAHLDFVNAKKRTALEYVSSCRGDVIQQLKKKIGVIRLKCFCARLIRQEQFSVENILSTSLVNFIQRH